MRTFKQNRPGSGNATSAATQPRTIDQTEDIAWYLAQSRNFTAPAIPPRGDFDRTT